ncbi:MAG: bifunctional hydroxymethylpyrimidine kinase/phosphomethylpyrimidine kinase [Bacteroidetes bacterium]|nr:bifunctional hydroxymethylpyrimidine kinase/phosphomethylpyrimidine kinase [Bacteroidota bacterium]
MNKKHLTDIFRNSRNKKIIIIGDLMLDRYLFGDVNRISPEAPVQVFDLKKNEYRLGGAANVAYNIKTLGADPFLIGVTGNDAESELLKLSLESNGISTKGIISEDGRPTTSKSRVISDSHHLLRIDSESKEEITPSSQKKILSLLSEHAAKETVIILQDYNKGVLTRELIKKISAAAAKEKFRILVDPKFDNFFEFRNAYLFKPNRKELEDSFGIKIKELNYLDEIAAKLFKKISCANIIFTLGEQGMMIYENHNKKLRKEKISTKARKVADVSGAGDTVISTIAVCLSGGASLRDSAVISNYAAGLVVQEVGIVPVYKNDLMENILKNK